MKMTLGYGAKFVHANLNGPHDMESVRASIAKKRFAKGQVTVSCEKDFRRLPSTEIIKESTPISALTG